MKLNAIDLSNDGKKTYAQVASVSPVMKGVVVPPQVNPSYEFNYEPFLQDKFDALPEFLRKKMSQSSEFAAVKGIYTANAAGAQTTTAGAEPVNAAVEGPGGFGKDTVDAEEPLPF